MKALLLGSVALLVLVGSAAGATSTVAWLQPVTLSDDSVFAPDIAVNGSGDALVAWQSQADLRVYARFRAADAGAWGRPVALGFGPASATSPDAALDPLGGAVVAWRRSDPPIHSRVVASYRSPETGRWEAGVPLSADGATHEPLVRMDDDGNATVAWIRAGAAGSYHVETAYRPAGGRWQPAVEVAQSAYPSGLGFAVGDDGVALLSWLERYGTEGVRAALGRRGAWQAPVSLVGVAQDGTSAAVGPGGQAVVAWSRAEHGNSLTQAAVLPAQSSTWRVATLSFEDGQAGAPEVAIDGLGNVTAVWATNVDFEASYLPAGADTWQRPVAISPPRPYAWRTTLAANRRGDAIVLWDTSYAGGEIMAAVRPAGSSVWHQPAKVAAERALLERDGLAVDEAGNAVAVWTHIRADGYAGGVRAATLDAAPPVLALTRIRTLGYVGEPLYFEARAFDVWSGLTGPVRWNFGDGGSGAGTSLRHVFRTPDEYNVVVEATDALGNVSRTAERVRVEPARPLRNLTRPRLSGVRRVGRELSCRPGRWSGSPPVRFTYAWLRDARPVPGATRPRYRVRTRDAGAAIACRVTATNPAGRRAVATSRALRIAA